MTNQNAKHFNPKTGTTYSGANLDRLVESAKKNGFKSTGWLTFTQLVELGGTILPGTKSTGLVMFPNGTMKWFRVFNLEQIEGLPEAILKAKPSAKPSKKPSKKASKKASAKKPTASPDQLASLQAQLEALTQLVMEKMS